MGKKQKRKQKEPTTLDTMVKIATIVSQTVLAIQALLEIIKR